jgi:hypothetical protein
MSVLWFITSCCMKKRRKKMYFKYTVTLKTYKYKTGRCKIVKSVTPEGVSARLQSCTFHGIWPFFSLFLSKYRVLSLVSNLT